MLILSACTQVAVEKSGDALATPSRPLIAWLASQPNNQYAETILDDPDFGTNVMVQANGFYFSAAGLFCRHVRVRVVVNGPPTETVTVCRDSNQQWFVAPRVNNHSDARP